MKDKEKREFMNAFYLSLAVFGTLATVLVTILFKALER